MKKIIKKIGGGSLGILFSPEERNIYGLIEGDIINIKIKRGDESEDES